ncbi:MAG: hypothetical protein AB7T63_17135 [Planctomycetota bacterium]
MSSRLTLSVAAATFLAALAGLWLLRGVRDDMAAQGQRLAALEHAVKARPPAPTPAATPPALPADTAVTLDKLARSIEEIDENTYDYFTTSQQDIYEIKRALGMLRGHLTRLQNQLAEGHGFTNTALPPKGAPLGQEDIRRLAELAAKRGVKVEPGRVTVRGFLNIAPNTKMPIEYFVTRFPESGHETMVHVLGDKTLDQIQERPHEAAKGMGLGVYMGLLAAGFREGEPFRPDPESSRDKPVWLLPDGDVVYLYVRYTLHDEEHFVPASEWVLDPQTGTHLPEDAFRFTGSYRVEDPETGEETVAAEQGGLLVSVWPNRVALVEVALEGALRNDYAYNTERIPDVAGRKEPLYLDLVFSKTPLTLADLATSSDGDAGEPAGDEDGGEAGGSRPDGGAAEGE